MERKKSERKDSRRDGKFYDSPVNACIRKRLEDKGWSAVQLQSALKEAGLILSAEAIRQWVSGYSQPKIDNIPLLAEALECSVNYLFGGTNILDIQRQAATLEDLHFTEAAIERIRGLSTCQSLGDRGLACGEAKDSRTVRAIEQYALLMKLLGDDEFYLFLTNANAYTKLDTTGWPERSDLDLPNGNKMNVTSDFFEDCTLRNALWNMESTLRRLRCATNIDENNR